jgi:hypothetical protein
MRIGRPGFKPRVNPHAVSNQNAGIGDSAYSRTQSIGDGVTNYPSYRVPIENRTGGTDAPTGAQRPNPAQPAGYHGGGRAVNFPRSAVAPSRRRGARAGATAHASARRQPRRAPRRGPLRGYDSSGPKSVTPRSTIWHVLRRAFSALHVHSRLRGVFARAWVGVRLVEAGPAIVLGKPPSRHCLLARFCLEAIGASPCAQLWWRHPGRHVLAVQLVGTRPRCPLWLILGNVSVRDEPLVRIRTCACTHAIARVRGLRGVPVKSRKITRRIVMKL